MLNEKQIDAIWESLPGLTIIKGKPQDQWNRLLRHEFAAAIEAASGPNPKLVETMQNILLHAQKVEDLEIDEEWLSDILAAALSAAGVTLKGE